MSARDNNGSDWHGGGGSINNGGGGLGNGGIGGGMGVGGWGGGAGYNGGAQSRTGLTTGTEWKGNTAFGRPGSMATGYATRDARSLANAGMGPTLGSYGQFRDMQGNPMFAGLDNPMRAASGFNAQQAARKLAALQAAQQGGLLGNPTTQAPLPSYNPVPAAVAGVNPVPENVPPQAPVAGYLPGWPGTGQWWGKQPWDNNQANWPNANVAPTPPNYGVDLHYGSGDWKMPSAPSNAPAYAPGNNSGPPSLPSSQPSNRGWGGWNSGWN